MSNEPRAHRLTANGVSIELGGRLVIPSLELDISAGSFVGLIGPNGGGKSTVLRCLFRALRPSAGTVSVGETNIEKLPQRSIARLVAAVPQEQPSDIDLSVRHVMELSRTPHRSAWSNRTTADEAAIVSAAHEFAIEHLIDRSLATLSGGERQRVLIARAAAQQCGVILLDEPTNHLDIRHQLLLLRTVSSLKCTVVAALHDLQLAARFCTHLVALRQGFVVKAGTTREVLTSELIGEVFGVDARCRIDDITGRLDITILDART